MKGATTSGDKSGTQKTVGRAGQNCWMGEPFADPDFAPRGGGGQQLGHHVDTRGVAGPVGVKSPRPFGKCNTHDACIAISFANVVRERQVVRCCSGLIPGAVQQYNRNPGMHRIPSGVFPAVEARRRSRILLCDRRPWAQNHPPDGTDNMGQVHVRNKQPPSPLHRMAPNVPGKWRSGHSAVAFMPFALLSLLQLFAI